MQPSQDTLLAAFKVRLESEPGLRREFVAAPLGVLRRAGIQVSPQKAERLRLELERGVAVDQRPSVSFAPPRQAGKPRADSGA